MCHCRLWHQLTLKLLDFVKNDYFVSNGGLVDVCEKNYISLMQTLPKFA